MTAAEIQTLINAAKSSEADLVTWTELRAILEGLKNQEGAEGDYTLDMLEDVDIDGFLDDAQVLRWNGTAWVNEVLTTDDIAEGDNLFFTISRSRNAISGGTGISYNPATGEITSAITQYTSAMARAAISLTTTGSGEATYNSSTGELNIPTPSSVNLYNSDGTLTGNRTVTMGTNSLIFNSQAGNLLLTTNGTDTYNFTLRTVTFGRVVLQNAATGYGDTQGFGTEITNTRGFFRINNIPLTITTNSEHPIDFRTNAVERMRIFSGGNIGINTTTDAGFRLDVNGTARVQGGLTVTHQNLTTTSIISDANMDIQFQGSNVGSGIRIKHIYGKFRIVAPDESNRILLENNGPGGTLGLYWGGTLTTFFNGQGNTNANFINNATTIGGNTSADASSILDVRSTTRGVLLPRMTTTQRDAIATPATGLQIYNTTTNSFNYYDGTAWVESGAAGSLNIYNTNGTLTGNRIVTMGSNSLTFTSVNTAVFFTSGGTTTQILGRQLQLNNGNAVLDDTQLLSYVNYKVGTIPGNVALDLVTNNTSRLRIFGGGNIGINTTTDAGFRLDVNGTARVSDNFTMAGNNLYSSGRIRISATGGNNEYLETVASGSFTLASGNTGVLKLGVPTIAPTSGNNQHSTISLSPGTVNATGTYSGFIHGIYVNNSTITSLASGSLAGVRIGTNSATNVWALYVDGSANNYFNGNVGIGLTNPTRKLHVIGDASISDDFFAATSTGKRAVFGATGDPDYRVSVDGDLRVYGKIRTAVPDGGTGSGIWKLGSSATGSFTLNTTQCLEVELNGTFYRIATLNPA